MTPGARVAAAIEVLDAVLDGAPAERALTRWARASRFAGSKDRAAVRDHVFDALRNLRSYAAGGGARWPGTSGRSVMIGAARAAGTDLAAVFSGQGHAPEPVREAEAPRADGGDADAHWNLPDPVIAMFQDSLGADAMAAASMLASRAPVTCRVNTARSEPRAVLAALAAEGITAQSNPLAEAAITVSECARRLTQTQAFVKGWFELQDASSQAVVEALPLVPGAKALDFCAGGGGKTLAMAARTGAQVWAHDAEPRRMSDLPARAARAGARVRIADNGATLPRDFSVVLADAPCSGSGAWRRAPDAKWRFSRAELTRLTALQDRVIAAAARHVAPGGCLAYATCSVLREENEARVAAFMAREPGWTLVRQTRWPICAAGDGFFAALLERE